MNKIISSFLLFSLFSFSYHAILGNGPEETDISHLQGVQLPPEDPLYPDYLSHFIGMTEQEAKNNSTQGLEDVSVLLKLLKALEKYKIQQKQLRENEVQKVVGEQIQLVKGQKIAQSPALSQVDSSIMTRKTSTYDDYYNRFFTNKIGELKETGNANISIKANITSDKDKFVEGTQKKNIEAGEQKGSRIKQLSVINSTINNNRADPQESAKQPEKLIQKFINEKNLKDRNSSKSSSFTQNSNSSIQVKDESNLIISTHKQTKNVRIDRLVQNEVKTNISIFQSQINKRTVIDLNKIQGFQNNESNFNEKGNIKVKTIQKNITNFTLNANTELANSETKKVLQLSKSEKKYIQQRSSIKKIDQSTSENNDPKAKNEQKKQLVKKIGENKKQDINQYVSSSSISTNTSISNTNNPNVGNPMRKEKIEGKNTLQILDNLLSLFSEGTGRTGQDKKEEAQSLLAYLFKDIMNTRMNFIKNKKPPSRNNQFKGIMLYNEVPSRFVLGEIYNIKGEIIGPFISQYKGLNFAFINVIFMDQGKKQSFRCVEPMLINISKFQFNCNISKVGTFKLSIFAGFNGTSSTKMRRVYQNPEMLFQILGLNIEAPRPQNLLIQIINNRVFIKWNKTSAITNVTLYQKGVSGSQPRKQYLISNYPSQFDIKLQDFADFTEDIVYVQISNAESQDGSLYFIASKFSRPTFSTNFQVFHHFTDQSSIKFQLNPPLPWSIDIGNQINFTCIFEEDVQNEIYITLPNKTLEKIYFIPSLNTKSPIQRVIKKKTQLNFSYVFNSKGSYLIQINSITGIALINRPVYVGKGIPILPDYSDLISPLLLQVQITKKVILEQHLKRRLGIQMNEPELNSQIQQKRVFLLSLLNKMRDYYASKKLILDENLNQISQLHSDDMAENNYFSHQNLKGQGPIQRAAKLKFNQIVSENIAQSSFLIQIHFALERSAIHLENALKKEWVRVGIGISRTKNGKEYIVAFLFSIRDLVQQPLSVEERDNIKSGIVSLILQRNRNIRRENNELSEKIRYWMDSGRSTRLIQYLMNDVKLEGKISSYSFTLAYTSQIIDKLKKTKSFEGFFNFSQVGVGIKGKERDSDTIEGYVVFK